MASQYDAAFINSGRRQLFAHSWIPQRSSRAILVLVPELNLHAGYYDRFAMAMAAHGIASHALDLRDGRRVAVDVDDMEALVCAKRLRESSLPLFLLGHGAGALTAGLYALARARPLAGLICESIALELPICAVTSGLARTLAAIAPRLPVLKLPHTRFSRDGAIVERMSADPLVEARLRAGQFAAMTRSGNRFRTSLAHLTLPLLVLHGSADAVTLPAGSEYLHEHAGSHDKTLQIFEGYYHDLINDLGHAHVVERIRQWIENRLNPDHRGQIGIAYINTDS